MVVAMAFGRSGLNMLLIASQVALSIVLPFVAFPLIYLTSSKTVMSVNVPKHTPEANDRTSQTPTIGDVSPSTTPSKRSAITAEEIKIIEIDKPRGIADPQPLCKDTIDFSNSFVVSAVAYAIWLVIAVANVYGIVALGLPG